MNIALESQELMNIGDWFRTLQACVTARYGKDKLSFTAAYPNNLADDLRTPMITYYYRQSPGSFGNSTERKPRQGPEGPITVDNTEGQSQSIVLMRQRFDYFVTFEIWESDGVKADELAQEFRRYLISLNQYFIKLGVGDMLFLSLDGTQNERQWRTDLVRRELQFQVVMDEITNVTSPNMLAFSIKGFVYRSLYHLIDGDGTPIDASVLEAQSLATTAAQSADVVTVNTNDRDPVVIQLN
jgi:hypothetical protein